MHIRPATPEDAEELLDLQKIAYLSEAQLNHDDQIPPLTQTLHELITEFSRKYIVKIVDQGRIIASGQAYLQEGTCYIGRMSVLPALRGQGIGSKLLHHLESNFDQATRYELFTGEKSIGNLAMYQRRGYQVFKSAYLGNTKVVFLEKLNQ
jgi:ribosomal protein S18 acetylase RimI-like enzyme